MGRFIAARSVTSATVSSSMAVRNSAAITPQTSEQRSRQCFTASVSQASGAVSLYPPLEGEGLRLAAARRQGGVSLRCSKVHPTPRASLSTLPLQGRVDTAFAVRAGLASPDQTLVPEILRRLRVLLRQLLHAGIDRAHRHPFGL